ncbi:MAG TPA: condensation domain-containing protein, partial [Phenylobacterium sp.]
MRCAAPTFSLVGSLDPSAMILALNQLIARHEILRTRYGHDADGPYQEVQEDTDPRLSWIDLSEDPRALVGPTLTAIMRAAYARPLDLERHGPLQSWIFKLRPAMWILALIVDHIALDNRSVQLLASEIFGNYRRNCAGLPDPRPPLALQYADYAIW